MSYKTYQVNSRQAEFVDCAGRRHLEGVKCWTTVMENVTFSGGSCEKVWTRCVLFPDQPPFSRCVFRSLKINDLSHKVSFVSPNINGPSHKVSFVSLNINDLSHKVSIAC